MLLLNSLCGDYTKRNVIGLQALCHCLALSIKLTTISNPPIVRTERLLSATVSCSRGGEKEHPPSCSNRETIQKTLCVSLLRCAFDTTTSSPRPPLVLLLLLFPLFCCSWILSSPHLNPFSSITEIIFPPRPCVCAEGANFTALRSCGESAGRNGCEPQRHVCLSAALLPGCSWFAT